MNTEHRAHTHTHTESHRVHLILRTKTGCVYLDLRSTGVCMLNVLAKCLRRKWTHRRRARIKWKSAANKLKSTTKKNPYKMNCVEWMLFDTYTRVHPRCSIEMFTHLLRTPNGYTNLSYAQWNKLRNSRKIEKEPHCRRCRSNRIESNLVLVVLNFVVHRQSALLRLPMMIAWHGNAHSQLQSVASFWHRHPSTFDPSSSLSLFPHTRTHTHYT